MTQVQDWPGRAEIVARAQQRRRRRRPFVLVVALLGACAAVLWGSSGHRGDPHDHLSLVVRVTISVVVVLAVVMVIGVSMLVMQGFGARWRDNYRPPIATGLPRPQRREVARAIRRGVPSPDPILRAVELEMAERLVRRRGASRWVLPAVVALELINAFALGRDTGLRVLAVALLLLWLWSLVSIRGAGRLLAASRPPA